MENKKVKLFFVILLVISVFPVSVQAFDQSTTHPGLTQEMISFYNEKNPNKIIGNGAQRIIDGSTQEDLPEWRSLNHFYDPVRNIGLYDNTKAVDWATTGGGIKHNDFTWNDAIDAYADGNMNDFYFALGHVLHLVEDMGVPEHTRNDQHLTGSPFETWAHDNKNQTTLAGLGKTLAVKSDVKKFDNVEGAMRYLADYSNGNFVSRDSINNPVYTYDKPKASSFVGKYAYANDYVYGQDKKLYIVQVLSDGTVLRDVVFEDKNKVKTDYSVLADYFDRLSAQIIPVGAGVIELAVEQGEKLKAERAKEKEERLRQAKEKSDELTRQYEQIEKTAFYIRYPMRVAYAFENHIWNPSVDFISSSAKSTGNGIALATERTATSIFDTEKASIFTSKTLATIGSIFVKEKASEVKQSTITFVQKVGDNLAPLSKFATTGLKTGLPADAPSIFGNSPAVVYVAPPAPIVAPKVSTNPIAPVSPMLFIAGAGGSPPAPALAPTDPTPAPSTPADPATTTPDAPPVDPPPADPPHPVDPPEISFDISECSSSLTSSTCLLPTGTLHARIISNVATGSEFALNIDDSVIATSTEKNIDLSLTPGPHTITASVSDIGSGANVTATPFVVEYVERPLAISEFAWNGTDDDYNAEWIEIHNTTNFPIDLTNFKLQGINDGTPNIGLSGTIAPNQYYLIENQTDSTVPAVVADLVRDFGGIGVGNSFSQSKILKSNFALNKLGKAPIGRIAFVKFVDFSSLQDAGEQLVLSLHVDGFADIVVDETPLKATCGGWCFGSNGFNNHTTMARNDFTISGLDPSAWVENVFEATNVEAQMDTVGAKFFGSPGAPDILTR